jgi:hypothetical protein
MEPGVKHGLLTGAILILVIFVPWFVIMRKLDK